MYKFRNDRDLKELENFGFYKIYSKIGTIKRLYNKKLVGYDYTFYDEEENRKDSIIYIDVEKRIVEFEKDYDYPNKERVEKERSKILNSLIQAGLIETV